MKRRDVLKLVAASAVAKPSVVLAAAGQNTKADIVVIGAGGAGYSAAVTAHDVGAKVIVLEKMPITGGNTQIASGGMNAAGTKHQAAQGIKDSWELMRDDTLKGGKNMGIPALVEILAKDSAAANDWMTSLGADLSGITRGGGASANRFHAPKDGRPVGPELLKVLRAAADQTKDRRAHQQSRASHQYQWRRRGHRGAGTRTSKRALPDRGQSCRRRRRWLQLQQGDGREILSQVYGHGVVRISLARPAKGCCLRSRPEPSSSTWIRSRSIRRLAPTPISW